MATKAAPDPPAATPPAAPLSDADKDAIPRAVHSDQSTKKNPSPFAERIVSMRRALERGELESAMHIAEEIVGFAGEISVPMLVDHAAVLTAVYEKALGDRSRVVRLGKLPPDLDPRSAFLLSRVDGSFTLDDLLDISGMDRPDAARMAVHLLKTGALLTG